MENFRIVRQVFPGDLLFPGQGMIPREDHPVALLRQALKHQRALLRLLFKIGLVFLAVADHGDLHSTAAEHLQGLAGMAFPDIGIHSLTDRPLLQIPLGQGQAAVGPGQADPESVRLAAVGA